MFGTVSSPSLATAQKQTVMHAKTAASSESSKSICDLKLMIRLGVNGSRLGRLDEGGANLLAPPSAAPCATAEE